MVGSPRLSTVRLFKYMECDATAICFLRSGEDVGARELLLLLAAAAAADALDVERGRLGAMKWNAGETQSEVEGRNGDENEDVQTRLRLQVAVADSTQFRHVTVRAS